MRTVLALWFLAVPAFADPITLKEDELAVLADPKSPDYWKLFDRHAGKVIRLDGHVAYDSGGYYVAITKPEVKVRHLEWSDDPANRKTKDQIALAKKPGLPLTAYGRMQRGDGFLDGLIVLADVTTDPKTGGVPFKAKTKDPPRLKDK